MTPRTVAARTVHRAHVISRVNVGGTWQHLWQATIHPGRIERESVGTRMGYAPDFGSAFRLALANSAEMREWYLQEMAR